MDICIAVITILSLILIYMSVRLIRIKKQLKNVRTELKLTKNVGYNRQITVDMVDTDITNLATEINHNLDYQKKLKYESEEAKQGLKQSISDIAHDLRTPLTVIKGNLQMLESSNLSDAERIYLDTCNKQADILKVMVDDFFEMSVLESDCGKVELKEINAVSFLMQFVIEHEAVIRSHNLIPDIRLPEKTVFIYADEQLLTRMLNNLLNNVLKYAIDTFCIELTAETDKCRITFSNQISERELFDVKHIFDRTYRGSKERRGNGAGLGLYIVKLLADKQDIEVGASKKDNRLQIDMTFKKIKK
ncbi:MAG: sensor histidine kinase [Coprococcus sp.]